MELDHFHVLSLQLPRGELGFKFSCWPFTPSRILLQLTLHGLTLLYVTREQRPEAGSAFKKNKALDAKDRC